MVKRRGIVSVLIRVFTAESYNHVAMLLNDPETGAFVVEMREGKGFQLMPASQWMQKNKKSVIMWGKSPLRGDVEMIHDCVQRNAMKHREANYSYISLLSVWWSQLTRRKVPHGLVCSTFVQRVWRACGYDLGNKAADPSDFAEHVLFMTQVKA